MVDRPRFGGAGVGPVLVDNKRYASMHRAALPCCSRQVGRDAGRLLRTSLHEAVTPERLRKRFSALRLALAADIEALFADSAASSSGYWLKIRAVLLIGVERVLMAVTALGYLLVMAAIFGRLCVSGHD